MKIFLKAVLSDNHRLRVLSQFSLPKMGSVCTTTADYTAVLLFYIYILSIFSKSSEVFYEITLSKKNHTFGFIMIGQNSFPSFVWCS